MLRQGDFFIIHTKKELGELRSIVKNPKYAINMHPTYEVFASPGGSSPFEQKSDSTFTASINHCLSNSNQMQIPQAISAPSKTLLFFGFIRPYKGLKFLLEALSQLEDVNLIIAGDFGGKREEYDKIIKNLGIESRVEIHDGYAPSGEVAGYFKRCDAAVLPYVDSTTSGIAQVAFGCERPIIATRVGGLGEVVLDGRTGVLCRCCWS